MMSEKGGGIHDVEKKERGQTCQRQRKRAGMMSETARGERANMMSEKGERGGRHGCQREDGESEMEGRGKADMMPKIGKGKL